MTEGNTKAIILAHTPKTSEDVHAEGEETTTLPETPGAGTCWDEVVLWFTRGNDVLFRESTAQPVPAPATFAMSLFPALWTEQMGTDTARKHYTGIFKARHIKVEGHGQHLRLLHKALVQQSYIYYPQHGTVFIGRCDLTGLVGLQTSTKSKIQQTLSDAKPLLWDLLQAVTSSTSLEEISYSRGPMNNNFGRKVNLSKVSI